MGIVSFLSGVFTRNKPIQSVTGSIYDFRLKLLTGKEIELSQFKGKKLMIVNTASKCGYTYQYADLQKLYEQYGDQITILGFPANNFLWQEPGNNNDIASFCEVNYGVTFPMSEKVSVKGGDVHPLYAWLQAKTGKVPSWNFCKYMFDEKGNFIGFYPPKVKPLDAKIIKKIKQ